MRAACCMGCCMDMHICTQPEGKDKGYSYIHGCIYNVTVANMIFGYYGDR